MRAWSIVPALLLLGACTGDDVELTETDTEIDLELTEADVFTTYIAASLPHAWAVAVTFATLGDAGSCPAVTLDSESQVTLTGGCTDEDTEWTGTAVVVENTDESGSFTYDDFGVISPEMTVTMDGVQAVDTESTLTSDLTARWDPGTSDEIVIEYTDYRLATLNSWFAGALGQESTATLAGTMDMDSLTTFDVSATFAEDETCDGEWSSATQTLSGAPAGDIVFTWGEVCDGCADWTHDDMTGTACD